MQTTSIARGFNGLNDRFGRPLRDHTARQMWAPGMTVNVGFLRGLQVIGRIDGNEWLLKSAKGDFYAFTAHQGIARLSDDETAKAREQIAATYA